MSSFTTPPLTLSCPFDGLVPLYLNIFTVSTHHSRSRLHPACSLFLSSLWPHVLLLAALTHFTRVILQV